MSSFETLLVNLQISPEQLRRVSVALESCRREDRTLRTARANKRRLRPEVTYAVESLAKPRSGRGVSLYQIEQAKAGRALPRQVRGKLTRALNVILAKRSQPPKASSELWGTPSPKAVPPPAEA